MAHSDELEQSLDAALEVSPGVRLAPFICSARIARIQQEKSAGLLLGLLFYV